MAYGQKASSCEHLMRFVISLSGFFFLVFVFVCLFVCLFSNSLSSNTIYNVCLFVCLFSNSLSSNTIYNVFVLRAKLNCSILEQPFTESLVHQLARVIFVH